MIEFTTSPSAERNKDVILQQLSKLLPENCRVFEIGSGTGQHAEYFTKNQYKWYWQTSDRDIELSEDERGLNRRIESINSKHLPKPISFDVNDEIPTDILEYFDVVYTANTLHIMPLDSVEVFFRAAKALLRESGKLVVYGPFIFDDIPTAESNLSFSKSLAQRIPGAGVREFKRIQKFATDNHFNFVQRIQMPANNFILEFNR